MAERKKGSWLWLLLVLPPLFAWLWWRHGTPQETEDTIPEPKVAEPVAERPLPPPRLAVAREPTLPPPRISQGTATPPVKGSSLIPTPLPPGDLSDAAIVALDPDTIAMLNHHKYWTPNGFVDGLYDVWLDKKRQGADAEDARRQIAWALKGTFIDEY
jgi:hypothetical protein